jgi:hypothetical protein
MFRDDRLGSNIAYYVAQTIFAAKENLSIFFIDGKVKYNESLYVKCLLDYVKHYNKKLEKNPHKWNRSITTMHTGDLCFAFSKSVTDSKSDFVTLFQELTNDKYFVDHFGGTFHDHFLKKCKESNYELPYDPSKTIVVHVRLDDMAKSPDPDCKKCADIHRDLIKNGLVCRFNPRGPANAQFPISNSKIQKQIDLALEKYPDREILIVSSPISNPEFPYRCIKSEDVDYDLFLLACSEVMIMSRSNYTFVALLFGNQKYVSMPLWGHTVAAGYDTIYDKKGYNYFY